VFLGAYPDPGPYADTPETSLAVPGGVLAPGGTYWWRVAASNGIGECAPAMSGLRTFTVSGPGIQPVPDGAQPGSGPIWGGTPVTISGSGLYLGATVTFDGLQATVTTPGDGSTLTVTAPAHAAGPVDVVVTNPGGLSASVPGGYQYAAPASARFFPVPPCRLVDTRAGIDTADVKRGEFLDDEIRAYAPSQSTDCLGLPSDPTAWSLNIQFRPVTQPAYLMAFPDGALQPAVSTVVSAPDRWRVNGAIVPAGSAGAFDVYCQHAGRVVIDVNGYFK
jgi:hypothetical protein